MFYTDDPDPRHHALHRKEARPLWQDGCGEMEVGHVDGAVHGLPQRMGQALLRNMGELHYLKHF